MYWLRPPPILRRAGAILLVTAAIMWDLRGPTTIPYPVAAAPIAAGTPVSTGVVAWVDLPEGLLPHVDPLGFVAASDIAPGEPLSSAVLTGPIVVPDGWWSIPIAIGTLARPGDEALLVVADPPLSVIGLVVQAQIGDPYDLDHRPASIAVPAAAAPLVAAAAQQGLLVTAIRSTTPNR